MKRKEYKKIIKELIGKSFPRLKKRIIFLNKRKIPFLDYFAAVGYFILFSWIFVNPKMDKLSKNQVKAVLAHELAQLEIVANKNIFEKVIFGLNWVFTKKGKRDFERDADLLAIKKGYGKGLFNRVKGIEKEYNNEKLEKRKLRGYLGSEEIKKYISKYKK